MQCCVALYGLVLNCVASCGVRSRQNELSIISEVLLIPFFILNCDLYKRACSRSVSVEETFKFTMWIAKGQ